MIEAKKAAEKIRVYRGMAAASGIAISKVFKYFDDIESQVTTRSVNPGKITGEL